MAKLVICGLLILTLWSYAEGVICPAGWTARPKDNSWCYLFTENKNNKNWASANAACAAQKGQLLKLDSTALKTWVIAEALKRQKIVYTRGYWIGLNKIKNHKKWVWTDNSAANPVFLSWLAGNPNAKKTQFCVSLTYATKPKKAFGLTDETCSNWMGYICRRRTNVPLYCDSNNGWQNYDGTCYKYMDYRRTWADARLSCEQNGGFLATILDDTDAAIVGEMGRINKRDTWIGLYSQPDPSTRFHWNWVNGSTVIPSKYWHQPDGFTVVAGKENSTCVAVSSTITSTRAWTSRSCFDEKQYVCEKPEGSCAPGWKPFGVYCYQFNTLMYLSYDSAGRHCIAQGGRLVEITTQDVQNFINGYLPGVLAAGVSWIWIGINDFNQDVYRYDGGRTISPAFKNFAVNPPPTKPNVKDCVNMYTRGGRWYPVDCLQQKPFICYASSRVVIRPITTLPPRVVCSSGWSPFQLQCYKFFDQAMTWLSAREDCQKGGGDLATIPDVVTQNWIQARVRADKWIGLNDQAREGLWVWRDDSTPVSFTNWMTGAPTSQGDQNCVMMKADAKNRGKWQDQSCVSKHGYVCQKDSLSFVTGTPSPPPTTSWSVNCGPSWEEHASLGHCYQFRTEQYTVENARTYCQHQGGDLASVNSMPEQNYLEARLKSFTTASFWIGATDKSTEGGWTWMDGSPFSYLNWNAGQPDDWQKNQDCARMLSGSGRWDDVNCFNRYAFICKKISSAATTTAGPSTVALTAPPGRYLGCLPGFRKFNNRCYLFRRQPHITWQNALKYCRQQGTDLATVQSKAENDYLLAQGSHRYKGYMWLGLNDLKMQMSFEWSDSSPIVYTNWNTGEPNNYQGRHEDCIAIGVNGGWNDFVCTEPKIVGFICETGQKIMAKTTPSPMRKGCRSGALGYYGSCYQFLTSRRNWKSAEQYCVSKKGHLATINDRYVQSFIVSEVATRSGSWWIGMSDTVRTGRMAWSSHQRIYYTNWDRSHTGKERGTCIGLGTVAPVGMWLNMKCTAKNQFVCEFPRTGFTNPPTTTRPTVQVNCPPEWSDFGGFCYKGIYAYETHLRKTWTEAKDYCRSYGADLASLHSLEEEQFIVNTVLLTMKYLRPGTYWIGMNDRAVQEGYEWSDKSPNDYVHWGPDQPNNHNNQEDCVEFDKDTMTWNDANCALAKSYICKIKKGLRVRTTLNPAAVTNLPKCSSGYNWISYNNSCYYVSYWQQIMTWFNARQYCLKQGGELVSIHNQDENALVTSLISKEARTEYWIGLNELSMTDYEWSDGTPVEYKSWAQQEPNDQYGGERCVLTNNINGEWSDYNCATVLNFICKRPDGAQHAQTLPPTPSIKGGCPPGFVPGGHWTNKCFLLGADVQQAYVNWTQARSICRNKAPNGDLVSINSLMDELLVTTMLEGRKKPVWIGMNDLFRDGQFVWSDNSPVKYTYWSHGEPNGAPDSANNGRQEDCVQLYTGRGWSPGRWNDNSCGAMCSYVCQAFKSASIPVGTPVPLPSYCKRGYTPHGESCYKMDTKARTWSAANAFCQKDGAHLLSITNKYEQGWMLIMLHHASMPYWIGLSDSQNSGRYVWTDGWPTLYTYWARGEPSKREGEGCVAMNPDGGWNDTLCTMTYPPICKISIASPPATTTLSSQSHCADKSWTPFNNYCYMYEARSLQSWSDAQAQCRLKNMDLVAVRSQQELTFILSLLFNTPNPYTNMWIGLASSPTGGFMWRDRLTADAYNNWAANEPSNEVTGYNEDCVEMNPVTGQWYDQACTARRGYICWAQKVSPSTAYPLGPITNPVLPPLTNAPGKTAKAVTKTVVKTTKRPVIKTPAPARTMRNPFNPFQQHPTAPVNRFTPRRTFTPAVHVTPAYLHNMQNNGDDKGLGGGAIAGIIVAIVILVAGLIGAGLLIRFKQVTIFNLQGRLRASGSMSKGFDNALYNKSDEHVNVGN